MNIKLILLFAFINDFGVIYPVYTYFFKMNHLTIQEVAIVLSALQLGKMFFDIPSGIIGDTFGKRNLIIASQFVRIAFLSFWLIKPGFYTFIVTMFLWGSCLSCFFGNLETMLYEATEKGEQKYVKLLGGLYALQNLAIACGAFVSSYLDVKKVIFLQIVVYIVSIPFAFLIKNDANKIHTSSFKNFISFTDLKQYFVHAKDYISLIIMEALYIFFIDFNYNLMIDLGFEKSKIAMVMSAASLLKIFSNFFSYKVIERKVFVLYYKEMYVCFLAVIYILNFCIFKDKFYILCSTLAYYLLYTVFSIKQTETIQLSTKKNHRATVMSLISLATSLTIIACDMTIGKLKIYNGIFAVMTCATIFAFIININFRKLGANLLSCTLPLAKRS